MNFEWFEHGAAWASRRLSGRYPAFPLLVLCFAILLSTPVAAKTKASFAKGSDPAYSAALAAANRFLQAWQNQDHETGLLMLTDAAKHHSSEDYLQSFFSPGSDTARNRVGEEAKARALLLPHHPVRIPAR